MNKTSISRTNKFPRGGNFDWGQIEVISEPVAGGNINIGNSQESKIVFEDDKIYVISNFKKENKYETFIYNFSGKLLKKTFVPLADQDLFNVYPFCIKNGKIYQLIEDEEGVILTIRKIE